MSSFAHIQRKYAGNQISWGDPHPDVYGPHHRCASCLFLQSLRTAILGIKVREMSEAAAQFQEISGKQLKTDTQAICIYGITAHIGVPLVRHVSHVLLRTLLVLLEGL